MITESVKRTMAYDEDCTYLYITSRISYNNMCILYNTDLIELIRTKKLYGSFIPTFKTTKPMSYRCATHRIESISYKPAFHQKEPKDGTFETKIKVYGAEMEYQDRQLEVSLEKVIRNYVGLLQLSFRIQRFNNKVLSADLHL